MSRMDDKIRTLQELSVALRHERRARKLKAIAIAAHSGKSRDVLHRLENGQDVTVQSLFDILRAMGLCIRLEAAGMPTLDEMRARFSSDDDDITV